MVVSVIPLLAAGAVLACLTLLVGIGLLMSESTRHRGITTAVRHDSYTLATSRFGRWDRAFRATRLGRWVQQQLVHADIDRRPLAVSLVVVGGGFASGYVAWRLLAPAFGIAGIAGAAVAVRAYLARGRARRLEAFINQMPELARVLANSVNAGLSIHAALTVAARELDDPASTELERVASRVRFGASLEQALAEIEDRLPSREVAVLVSTLIVCARSGGELVTSLRDISVTLEERKEVRREVRTTLAQALVTGYLVIAMGFGLLLLLNTMRPGTVREMTTELLGQVALVVAFGLFGLGVVGIRRITRIEA